ncbi:inositol-tetrakisphosphate 1-kinase 1-like [Panicum virgatum]|uniref:inositol-tetrakisphosphate 1-kinase 1-like n=1 Tax=Panicum virgatum TaxID=38727 RepID=UPI0019D65DC4|nr:inositol-tetrakisphosphate 1-kinase 1-like [Panicum virgatum]
MASDAAAAAAATAEPSSGDTQCPPRYAIGYVLAPKKQQSFIQPSLVARAAARGMDLIPVDAARPLAEQGPFHLLIHKLYGDGWRAQLEAFAARHAAVPVVDPPHAIDRLHNRISMLQAVSELDRTANKDHTFGIPSQVVVYDAPTLADSGLLDALRFPLIAKPLVADGTTKSHKMSLVYHREGLAKLRPLLVFQEFVNHGGPMNGGGRKGGVAAPRADPATAAVARAASTQEHRGGSRRGGRRRLADGGGGRWRRSSSGRASPSPRELAGYWAQREGLDFESPLLETGFCAAFCVATVDEANTQMHSHFALHCWSQS